MQYDPIKRKLGVVFNQTPGLRKLFYRLLDILLLRSWHIRKAFKVWEKEQKEPAHILDAGSGFGQYDYYMGKKHPEWNIKGIDVKAEQIEDCNGFFQKINFNHVRFEVADLIKFTEPETYDMVLCVDVMEHIEEDVKVLENFQKSLKKGGMLLISTPSDQGGSDVHHDHDHEEGENHSFIDEHVRDGYGIEEIKTKMLNAGFSKTEVHYQYGPAGRRAWRLSMKYPIIMLNTSYLFFVILPFYYIITFPFVLILNLMDVKGKHKTGTGLIAKAWK
ncbi:MAG: class I SAM-dependent methyltransferase [Bacteroidales bacterium]|nr:class I SAM-dependent methyltransferase [Bacteroidales bacterium]